MAEEKPCVNSVEARQFDFWVGEWDLTWGEEGRGTNSITKIYDGCVIQENFDGGAMDFKGMSISTYDTEVKKWKQTWVDSAAGYIDLAGEFENGEMQLFHQRIVEGKRVDYRMRFFNIVKHTLDWSWERSNDQGQTWEVQWLIQYQRKA